MCYITFARGRHRQDFRSISHLSSPLTAVHCFNALFNPVPTQGPAFLSGRDRVVTFSSSFILHFRLEIKSFRHL